MPVNVETPIATSTANGVTTVYPYSFTVLKTGDLVVTATDSLGNVTTYTSGVDYTLSGVGTSAGSVTFNVAPANGLIITRYRSSALSRATDYQQNGDLLSDTLDSDLDRTWLALQEIFNGSKTPPGSIRVPAGETVNALPPAALRAGFLLGFDGAGAVSLIAAAAQSASALALALLSNVGSTLWSFLQGGTGAVLQTGQAKLRQIVNAKDFGALSTNTQVQNKAAVQLGITYLNSVGGGRLEIDADCNYGYKVRDLTTHPNFAGCTADIIVIDRSAGASYVAPAKDGAQVREFSYTAQTSNALIFALALANGATSGTLAANWIGTTGPWLVTFSNGDQRVVTLTNGAATATWATGLSSSATTAATYLNPGNHDGNTRWWRTVWGAFWVLSNDSAVPAVGNPNRTVTDNRRAHYGVAIDGNISWYWGQGNQAGYNYSDGQMANFHLNRAMVVPTVWISGTHYVPDMNVTQGGVQYVCLVDHVAGVFATDLGVGNWIATPQETTLFNFDYQTGRVSFNRDSNGFLAGYHLKERTPGVVQLILESLSANCYSVLRNSAGSSQDVTTQNNAGDMKFLTAFGTVATAGLNGRFGVGSAGSPLNKLEVIDSRNGQYAVAFRNNDATAGYGLSIASGTTGTTAFSLADFYDLAGLKCAIRGNGNLVNTNNSYGAISDAKLKTNVEPAPSYWDKVKRLGKLLKTYTLIDDPSGQKLLGLVAQEAQEVSNGIVDSSPDYELVDGERRLTGTSTLSVKYSIASLMNLGVTAEVQERVEQQDATIAALVKRIEALEARG